MPRSFLHDKRGVSEIVASLIILLIVSVAGTGLYSYSLNAFSSSGSSFLLQTSGRQERARERLLITTVWWDNSTGQDEMNVTILNYGKIDLAVDAVYIDGTPVSSFSSGNGITVVTGKLISVKFTSPVSIQSGETYEIIVVSERGSRDVVYWKA